MHILVQYIASYKFIHCDITRQKKRIHTILSFLHVSIFSLTFFFSGLHCKRRYVMCKCIIVIYKCKNVRDYLCACVHRCITRIYLSIYIYIYMYRYIYIHIHISVCIYICMYMCVYIYVSVHIYMRVWICLYLHIHIYIYT